MKQQHLLIVGLILVAASILGPALQGSSRGWPPSMFDHHMRGYVHMGWGNDPTSPAVQIEGARDILITATEFGFAPSEINVAAGESVNFVLVNEGRATHDFSIPGLGVGIVAGPGEQSAAGVSLDGAGTYQILCTIPGHAAAGMTGTLQVSG